MEGWGFLGGDVVRLTNSAFDPKVMAVPLHIRSEQTLLKDAQRALQPLQDERTFQQRDEISMRLPPANNWFKNEGASADALQRLAEVTEAGLPREYFDLLA